MEEGCGKQVIELWSADSTDNGKDGIAGRARDPQEAAVFEIKEILELAIRLEKNGEATYRKAMALSSDASMNALLQWMADEEVSRREWFAALKSDLDIDRLREFKEKEAGVAAR
jgi:rubrerythrin